MIYKILLSIILFIFTHSVTSKTINVPADFNSIQQAVNESFPGDVVSIKTGIYKESIKINKNIKLKGEGSNKTTLLGLISISKAKDVEICGFRIEGFGKDTHFGIWCEDSSVIITNNVIVSYHHCIGSTRSAIIIDNNEITKSLNSGILIENAVDAQIKYNLIAENLDAGILVGLSEDKVSITDNVVINNRIGIACAESRPIIRRNVIMDNQIGVQTDNKSAPDIGTEKDHGLNVITNNKLNIVNLNRKYSIMAKGNYWGSSEGPSETSFDGRIEYDLWLKYDPLLNHSVDSKYHISQHGVI